MEVQKLGHYDCFIFHDVDMVPVNLCNVYRCDTKAVRHLGISRNVTQYVYPMGTHYRQNTASHIFSLYLGGHGGAVVTHSPPTSEVGGSHPGPYVGKLVVAYQWLVVNRRI